MWILWTNRESESDVDYKGPLRHLISLVRAHAKGPVIWSYTTAAHPERANLSRLSAQDRFTVQYKFKDFSNIAVLELNKISDDLIKSEFPYPRSYDHILT